MAYSASSVMNSSSKPSPRTDAAAFPLIWAVALSGHCDLPDEAKARKAIRAELQALNDQAAKLGTRLIAISSIARGADLVFAEECLEAGLLWKCLLPFQTDEFRKTGFSADEWIRAEKCIARAYRVEVVTVGIPVSDTAREAAFRECGHRMIESSDVVMLVLDGRSNNEAGGTSEMAEYASTLSKPVWQWNPLTDIGEHRGWPGEAGGWVKRRLFNSRVTPLVLEASRTEEPPLPSWEKPDTTPRSSTQKLLESLFRRLDHLALQKQGDAQKLMQGVVFSHILATTAAALSVTVVASGCWHALPEGHWFAYVSVLLFSFLVLAKPAFATVALLRERRLHQLHTREHWVEARVAAEFCRCAITTWRFQSAPLNVFSEEDFPHFKRLIRTLRTAREIDTPDATTLGEERSFEHYVSSRLDGPVGQIEYFKGKHEKAVKEHGLWQGRFNIATWTVIIVGSLFGVAEALDACCNVGPQHGADHSAGGVSHYFHLISPVIACVLIVAPFYASYALAVLSIRDCRRRCDRFKNMQEFLERQKHRLSRIKTPASRIAVVENTERMLLEELHEWYSVMRAVKV